MDRISTYRLDPRKGSSKKMQDVGSRKMCGGEPVSKQEMEYNH